MLTILSNFNRIPAQLTVTLASILLQVATLLSCEFGSDASGRETVGILRRRRYDGICRYYEPRGKLETIPRHGAFVSLCLAILVLGMITLRMEKLYISIMFMITATCQALTFVLFLATASITLDSGGMFSIVCTLTLLAAAICNTSDMDHNDDDESASTSSVSREESPLDDNVVGSEITFEMAVQEQNPASARKKTDYEISARTGRKILSMNRSSPDANTERIRESVGESPIAPITTYRTFTEKSPIETHPKLPRSRKRSCFG